MEGEGAYLSPALPLDQLDSQRDIPKSVVIIYDPRRTLEVHTGGGLGGCWVDETGVCVCVCVCG